MYLVYLDHNEEVCALSFENLQPDYFVLSIGRPMIIISSDCLTFF